MSDVNTPPDAAAPTALDLSFAVLSLENPVLLALAVVEAVQEMVALAVVEYAEPARRVADAIELRLLERHGGRMADEVAALADILPGMQGGAGRAAPAPAELAALVALTHAAVAVEGIASGHIYQRAFALRFFQAAEGVHRLHAPADDADDAPRAARQRVLLRIAPPRR